MKTFHEIVEKYGDVLRSAGLNIPVKDASNTRVIKNYKLVYKQTCIVHENILAFLGGITSIPTNYIASVVGNPTHSRIITRGILSHFTLELDGAWFLKIFEAGFLQLYPDFGSNTANFRAIKQIIPDPWSVELREDSIYGDNISLTNKLVPDKIWVLSRAYTYTIKDFKVYDNNNRRIIIPRGLTNG